MYGTKRIHMGWVTFFSFVIHHLLRFTHHKYLNSKDFKAMMSNLVGDILEEDSAAGDNAGVGRVLNPTTGL